MLDLYVLQVKKGNLIWLNFWFLKIVQSMEFTLNLYSLFFFFFFKNFETSFLFVFFKTSHHHRQINHLWLLHVYKTIWRLQNYYYKMEHISLFKFVGFFDNFPQNNPLSSFFLFFLSIYHQFGFGKTGTECSSSSLWFPFW